MPVAQRFGEMPAKNLWPIDRKHLKPICEFVSEFYVSWPQETRPGTQNSSWCVLSKFSPHLVSCFWTCVPKTPQFPSHQPLFRAMRQQCQFYRSLCQRQKQDGITSGRVLAFPALTIKRELSELKETFIHRYSPDESNFMLAREGMWYLQEGRAFPQQNLPYIVIHHIPVRTG